MRARENSCGCRDHAVNQLGTCKHIEGTLFALRRGRSRLFDQAARRGSPWAEIFVHLHEESAVRLTWPADDSLAEELRGHLRPWFADDGALRGNPLEALPSIRRAIAALPTALRHAVRVSGHLEAWLEAQRRRTERSDALRRYLAEAERGEASVEPLRLPLLPYQRAGMLHLAFGERALLADDMGLGKTAQAIAACVLLREWRGIERVLVVTPASLKTEWQDQIARFIGLPTRIVEGNRSARLDYYREPQFFSLANYEQIIPDGPEINRLLKPDVVILDEAQRIKNWQTKTARAVKALDSPYAFVLTGTPLENRIDEVYSIVQFLDPGLLGPLFRFNRNYYELDDRGRPIGYRNLDDLHRRLTPVMLRRRRQEVEGQLPRRTTRTHLVPMHEEQRVRYGEYELRVAQLLAKARRRPLSREEFDLLQQCLACMRMLCDTPYILDPGCRACPKLEELESVLTDLLTEPDCKIIIFSEWVRMLELVAELAAAMDLDVARHTGKIPQQRRRAEIRRFREDPFCRLLLSSDSGSVGLNLQVANVVINLDLPWNPAKLEQRIARAWRKHQTRPVRVFNLVTEDSIEERMQDVLALKHDLAVGVLDGRGDLKALRMPSGRAAFIERLDAVMSGPRGDGPVIERSEFCAEQLRDGMLARHGDRLLLLELRRNAAGDQAVLAVIDGAPDIAAAEARRLTREYGPEDGDDGADHPRFQVIDRAGYDTLRNLVSAGLVEFKMCPERRLHEAPCGAAPIPPMRPGHGDSAESTL